MEVAGRIQRRWLAFARHAVPAALDGSKHWAPYEEEKRSTLLIDSADTLVSDPRSRTARRLGQRRDGVQLTSVECRGRSSSRSTGREALTAAIRMIGIDRATKVDAIPS